MSLMSGLYVGNSGLTTNQNAINTVSHNLANIDTVGYTRQQVIQSDKEYMKIGEAYISVKQTGLGVSYAQVRQVRDKFLDDAYRLENGRTSFYSKSYDVTTELESLFGEMEGVEFQDALKDLWKATQELQKDPSNGTNKGLFVSTASIFLEQAQAVYGSLSGYQDTLNQEIYDTVDKINQYGKKILDLNEQIQRVEAGQIEKANDLRDTRNGLIDELSAYGNLDVSEDISGAVYIQFEGHDFVCKNYMNEMECETDNVTKFHDVVWASDTDLNGNKVRVYDLERAISSDLNTDVGGLKAMLVHRGSERGTYQDIPNIDDYYHADGTFNTDNFTSYREAADAYADKANSYNITVGSSLMRSTMAEFDNLVHGIAAAINDILNPTVTQGVDKNGNPAVYKVTEKKDGSYEYTDDTGAVHTVTAADVYSEGINLFLRKETIDAERSTELAAPVDDTNPNSWYTTVNLQINPFLLQQWSSVGSLAKDPAGSDYTNGFMTLDGQENRDLADALTSLFDEDFAALNPNMTGKVPFVDYYNQIISDLATKGNEYKNDFSTQELTVESIEAARQTVVGVSDNEELTNLIMYQNAYNASSRYINTVNEMLEQMLNSLAG